jgi:carbon storage regulator
VFRLGIEAPSDVRIYRYEIWVQVQEENRAAAQSSVDDLPSASS